MRAYPEPGTVLDPGNAVIAITETVTTVPLTSGCSQSSRWIMKKADEKARGKLLEARFYTNPRKDGIFQKFT